MEVARYFMPSRLVLLLLWFVLPLMLSGCGDSSAGTYTSMKNPNDKIEILSSTKARLTVIEGKNLDVWEYGGGSSGFAGQLQAARQAKLKFETIDATYQYINETTIRFEAPGRGSRLVKIDKVSGIIADNGGRRYVRLSK